MIFSPWLNYNVSISIDYGRKAHTFFFFCCTLIIWTIDFVLVSKKLLIILQATRKRILSLSHTLSNNVVVLNNLRARILILHRHSHGMVTPEKGESLSLRVIHSPTSLINEKKELCKLRKISCRTKKRWIQFRKISWYESQ